MNNYLEILNLPKLPDEFINQIIDGFEILKKRNFLQPRDFLTNFEDLVNTNDINELGLTKSTEILRSLKNNNISIKEMAADWNYKIDLPKGLEEWVKENVMINSIPKIFIFGLGNRFYPHIDPRKEIAINFLIRKGGSAKTTFYKVKKEYSTKTISPTLYLPYESLEKVAEYEVEQYQWYKFNPEIPHSVENMSEDEYRIILSTDLHLQKKILIND